jgi:hypothetical protein
MHRRHYLAAATSALTIALAGCSGGDGADGATPTPTENTPTEETPDDATPIEPSGDIDVLRSALEDRDIDIDALFRDGPYITLDYFTQAESETDEQLDEEIVAVSQAFAETVDEYDQGLETLECLALVNEGEFLDQFDIQAEWARSYAAGELSDEEYTQRVIDTLEYR